MFTQSMTVGEISREIEREGGRESKSVQLLSPGFRRIVQLCVCGYSCVCMCIRTCRCATLYVRACVCVFVCVCREPGSVFPGVSMHSQPSVSAAYSPRSKTRDAV